MLGLFSCDADYKHLHAISYNKNVLEKMIDKNPESEIIKNVTVLRTKGHFYNTIALNCPLNTYKDTYLQLAISFDRVVNFEKNDNDILLCYFDGNEDTIIIFSPDNLNFLKKKIDEKYTNNDNRSFYDFSEEPIELDKFYEEGCMNA